MGLFGGKSTTVLSSVLYNLAGPENDRDNYLKATVVGAALSPQSSKTSLGETIIDSQLNGPGIDQRNFFRWARSNYPLGTPTASIKGTLMVDADDVADQIPVPSGAPPGTFVRVHRAFIEAANYFYFAERYMLRTHPSLIGTNWTADYLSATNQIVIQFEDTSTVTISGGTYERDKDYLMAYYELIDPSDGSSVNGSYLHIYEIGSGNAVLDAMQTAPNTDLQEFFPFIPLRIENQPLNNSGYSIDFYNQASKAYKKATGENVTKVLADIEDNEDIDDVDYAFVAYGVSLNVRDNSSKRYLYEFFRNLIPYQTSTPAQYNDFIARKDTYESQMATYNSTYSAWKAAQSDPGDPLYGTPKPARVPALIPPEFTTIRIHSNDVRVSSYDMRMSWITIDELLGTGLNKPGAKAGDVWMDHGPTDVWVDAIYGSDVDGDHESLVAHDAHTFYIHHQIDSGNYRILRIKGLIHQNFVYDGRSVDIDTKDALSDLEESGFLVPIHYPTLTSMSLVDGTQLTTANMFIIFNCYEVVKQKWYQTKLFQIILVIGVAILTVVFAPAGAVTAGILGTNAAVGASLGLTGTTALIAGAAANAIAAMVLVQIITNVSTRLFGEKWGGVIAAVVAFIAVQGITSMTTGGQMGLNWGQMMRADNLIRLSQVGAQAYTAWVQGDIAQLQQEGIEAREGYESDLKEIDALRDEMGLNNGGGVIDPLWFLTPSNFTSRGSSAISTETPDQFLDRTTMVGSDIVELSHAMINDYVEMNLTLPNMND